MTKTQPTAQQIQELTKDWVAGRNATTHIHKDLTGTIMHAVKGGYSSYFTGKMKDHNGLEFMRTARIIAQHTIDTMVKRPVKVTLGGDASFTDGNSIQVSSDYFDEGYANEEKIDLLIGYAIHEACHINHSVFTGVQKGQQKSLTDELRGHLVNILEDERIEYLLGEPLESGGDAMPGYSDFIGCCKRRTFGKYEEKMRNAGELDEITRFLNALLVAVRFTSELPVSAAEEFYDELSAARKVLTPYPRTFEDVQKAADAIIDILKDMIRRKMQQQQEQKKRQKEQGKDGTPQTEDGQSEQSGGQGRQDPGQQQDKDGRQDGDSQQNSSGEQGGDQKSNGQQEDKNGQQDGDSQKNSGGEQDGTGQKGSGSQGGKKKNASSGNNGGDKGGTGQEAGGSGAGGISKEDVDKALEKELNGRAAATLMDALFKAEHAAAYNKERGINISRFNTAYVDGNAEYGSDNPLKIIYEKFGDGASYDLALGEVRSLMPAMTAALRCRTEDTDYVLQGERSGRLNLYKIVQCRMGCPNVYERRGTVTTDSACVCLLIDESGSMRGKLQAESRAAAVLVSEAMKGLDKVELFAYGFCSDVFTVYQERDIACRTALGATMADGGTPTAPALLLAQKRIRNITDRTCLMLVLTDGKPNDIKGTVAAVNKLKGDGFVVVGVDLTNGKSIMDIFEDAVSVDGTRELVPCVRSLMEERLLPLLERRDNREG